MVSARLYRYGSVVGMALFASVLAAQTPSVRKGPVREAPMRAPSLAITDEATGPFQLTSREKVAPAAAVEVPSISEISLNPKGHQWEARPMPGSVSRKPAAVPAVKDPKAPQEPQVGGVATSIPRNDPAPAVLAEPMNLSDPFAPPARPVNQVPVQPTPVQTAPIVEALPSPPIADELDRPDLTNPLPPRTPTTLESIFTALPFAPHDPEPEWKYPTPVFPLNDFATPPEHTWQHQLWVNCKYEGELFCWKIQRDFYHMYDALGLLRLGAVVAVAAPFANTDMDQNLSNWYQKHVHEGEYDRTGFYKVAYELGQYKTTVPLMVAGYLLGKCYEDTEAGAWLKGWGGRSIRGMMVGAPTIGVLQFGLGASRPTERVENGSHWTPFRDTNSVSGHAFICAVPWLTAASMCKNPVFKTACFAGSFLTSWARLDDNGHYPAQIFMGWCIAYLAVQSVNDTEAEYRRWRIEPIDIPNGVGMGVSVKF